MLLLCLLSSAAAAAPTVTTQYGPVSGFSEGSVDIFRSIPYASPPTGKRRFRPPVPPSNWTVTKDAAKQPNSCPQPGAAAAVVPVSSVTGNEDCLYLQVYSPSSGSASPKPVLLFVHGGGFVHGNSWNFGMYDGARLAKQHDVVVVSTNYRLGTFGFLGLPELTGADGVVGNNGVLDQRMAMRWVRDNIANFRGDPSRVTLFGESAGGESMCYHFVSPASRGLFAGAIMESGHCGLQYADTDSQFRFGAAFARHAGCNQTGDALVACLQSKPMKDLVYPTKTDPPAIDGMPALGPIMPWYVTVDGTDVGLPAFPLALLEAGRFETSVPFVVGHNTDEFFFGVGKKSTDAKGNMFVRFVRNWLKSKVSLPLKDDDAAAVLSHVLGAPVSNATVQKARAAYYPVADFHNPTERISQMLIDSGAWIGHAHDRRVAQAVARHGGTVYQYHFARRGKYGTVGHGAELSYVFQQCGVLSPVAVDAAMDCQGAGALPPTADRDLMHAMGSYWTNFARYSDPNGGNTSTAAAAAALPRWPVYDIAQDTGALLDSPVSIESKYRAGADAFWRSTLQQQQQQRRPRSQK